MRTSNGWGSAARWVAAGLTVVAASVTIISAASKAKLTSPWRDRDITVDGIGSEWRDVQPLAKNIRWSIGLASDSDDLYMALITSDAATSQQFLRQGLIVWFDAKGGKKKAFGIRFPVGVGPGQRSQREGGWSGPGGDRGGEGGGQAPGRRGREFAPEGGYGGRGAAGDVGEMFSRAEADGELDHVEILREGQDPQDAIVGRIAPLEVKAGWREGTLVYEMKIPLAQGSHLAGLGVRPGAIIGLGLETPKRNEEAGRMGRGGEGRGGGIGGGMGRPGGAGGRGGFPGGMGGGMGRGMPGGEARGGFEPNTPSALNLWTTVLISAGPGLPQP